LLEAVVSQSIPTRLGEQIGVGETDRNQPRGMYARTSAVRRVVEFPKGRVKLSGIDSPIKELIVGAMRVREDPEMNVACRDGSIDQLIIRKLLGLQEREEIALSLDKLHRGLSRILKSSKGKVCQDTAKAEGHPRSLVQLARGARSRDRLWQLLTCRQCSSEPIMNARQRAPLRWRHIRSDTLVTYPPHEVEARVARRVSGHIDLSEHLPAHHPVPEREIIRHRYRVEVRRR
jgi:hypothetical protein